LCQRLVLHCNLEAGVHLAMTGSSRFQEQCSNTVRSFKDISCSRWAIRRHALDVERSFGSRMFSGAEAGKETQVDCIMYPA